MPELDLAESPLLAAESSLDRPAVIQSRTTWTWRQVHETALALSLRLSGVDAVCNLCASRLGFLVTCLAAWRARCLLVLPPSGGNADIAAVLNASALTLVVGDSEALPELWRNDHGYLRLAPEWKPATTTSDDLAWQPSWDDIAVRFYTSGSTGAPEPQPKTLRHLARGALVLGARLEGELDVGLGSIEGIVSSVPQQHMFGFECSLMLPLVHAIPVLDRRPLLPADVLAAFAATPRAAWIATPLHLRSLVQAAAEGPRCSVIVTSTMPLGEAVARRSEQLCAAPVLEIYGSTETGALAMRRTARETRWRPLQGVGLECGDDGVVAAAPTSPVRSRCRTS
jgi:acyl-CoA synthetase (AMP-forming)/AMP-acid ligase II